MESKISDFKNKSTIDDTIWALKISVNLNFGRMNECHALKMKKISTKLLSKKKCKKKIVRWLKWVNSPWRDHEPRSIWNSIPVEYHHLLICLAMIPLGNIPSKCIFEVNPQQHQWIGRGDHDAYPLSVRRKVSCEKYLLLRYRENQM